MPIRERPPRKHRYNTAARALALGLSGGVVIPALVGGAAAWGADLADTTKPVVLVSQRGPIPPFGWNATPVVTLDVTATDDVAVSEIWVQQAGRAAERFTSATVAYEVTSQGSNDFTFWAVDTSGNRSADVGRVIQIDTLPPTISFAVPSGVTVAQGAELILDYECADEPGGSSLVVCNGSPNGEALPTDVIGLHTRSVTAKDLAGNSSFATFEYRVVAPDTSAPFVSGAAENVPSSGWFDGPAAIAFASYDTGSGLELISWQLSGAEVRNGSSATSPANDLVQAEGSTVVTYEARDRLGNVSSPQSFTVRIDRTAPEIVVIAPEVRPGVVEAVAEIEQGATAPFEYHCVDPLSGVARCQTTQGELDTLPSDVLGQHTVNLVATDVAGNESSETFTYVVVESDRPDPGTDPEPNPGQQGEPGTAAPGKTPTSTGSSRGTLADTGLDTVAIISAAAATLVAGLAAMLFTRRRSSRVG